MDCSSKAPQVLLVDDLAINRRVMRQLLNKCGFSVIEACDGMEALATFARERPNLSCVLLDLRMPKLDGWHTAQQLRQMEAEQDMLPSTNTSDVESGNEGSEGSSAASSGTYTMPRRIPVVCCTATALDERMCFNTSCSAPCCTGGMDSASRLSALTGGDFPYSGLPSASPPIHNNLASMADEWASAPQSPMFNNSVSGPSSSGIEPGSQSGPLPTLEDAENCLMTGGQRLSSSATRAPRGCGCPHSWGHTTVGDAALMAGADDVVAKPLGMLQLEQVLDRNMPAWRSLVPPRVPKPPTACPTPCDRVTVAGTAPGIPADAAVMVTARPHSHTADGRVGELGCEQQLERLLRL